MVNVSDFDFHHEVGSGAYGVVWEVKRRTTNEIFAMKVINFHPTTEGIPQSVIREMGALMSVKKLRHNNVIQLHDAFINTVSKQKSLYILYEKCDWDLSHFLENIPRDMGESQCRWFAFQMFSGLNFLHKHGIIHRDIKPQNILINKDQTLKIADFGLARNFSLHATFTTTVVTLWYRAPELLLQCSYNTAVDVWSAGCIVVELFIRQAMFPLSTETDLLFAIFERLGTPDPCDWPEDSVVAYSTFLRHPKRSICELYPILYNYPPVITLIDAILKFNYNKRPTAGECLHHHWFSSLHPEIYNIYAK